MKGVYTLLIFLRVSRLIKIGKRFCRFPKGYYCYVGSAVNGLEKRIQRHKSNDKKYHWHIDYLLRYGKIIDAFIIEDSSDECGLSGRISALGGKIMMKKFGSTDCKCLTHLYYFQNNPSKIIASIPSITKSFI
jgi:Uri superfamily endonuclease